MTRAMLAFFSDRPPDCRNGLAVGGGQSWDRPTGMAGEWQGVVVRRFLGCHETVGVYCTDATDGVPLQAKILA